ncbi:ATP-binding cassette domain-containing protein [Streptomyces sp. NPDC021080]|uniref:ABC transporter permease subunit n=1 Tax=Streptomyces sp. NPDC021080 TaxID=3365110 RepID=UPI0037AD276B
MSTVIQFAVLGLATGGLYVLFALGLVIIHRGSGVVNFAHGAVGMVGTFVYWELDKHLPFGLAALIGVAASGALGLAIHFLVMRPLRATAVLTRVIATLSVLAVLQEGMAKVYPGAPQVVTSALPTEPVRVLGASVGWDRLIILAGVLLTAGLLAAVYRFTQFGRATAAATENPRALAALGKSPDLLAAGNWVIGSALAGLAGIFLAPITNLSVTGYTLLVVPALAAAITGRLNSFPLTLAGGLLIGVLQSEAGRYITAPGWSEAIPFLAMLAVLVLRGNDRTSRTQLAQRLPSLGTGRVMLPVVAVLLVVTAVIVLQLQPEWDDAVTTTVGTALILLSLVVVTGYSGQLSLAQVGFAGWGAWVAGGLARSFDTPFPAAILIGALATLPLGLVLGAVCLRTRGVNLAIATLGMAVALDSLIFNNADRTGGGSFMVPTPTIAGLDIGAIVHPERYALVVLVVFAFCALAVANLRRGRSGRRLIAVRSNEKAAASLGIGVVQAKLAAFAVSSVIAGLGGALLAFRNPTIVFTGYGALESIQVVGFAVVGGVGWVAGSFYGGLLESGSLMGKLLDLLGPTVSSYLPLAGGVLLLAVLLTAPDGMAAQGREHLHQLLKMVRRPLRQPAIPDVEAAGEHRLAPGRLELEDVVVAFGGVQALGGVSLTVGPGEIVGLIGPNGAGKTTLIDAATGYVDATRGRVLLNGEDLTRTGAGGRVRAGLTRSFQALELFDDLTVLDNLRAASERRDTLAYVTDLVYPRTVPLTAATRAAIREFGLQPYLHRTPAELPYGVRRLVGIARAVATEASIVALDEPAAGLDDQETRELGELLRRLASEWGMGILLVEHDVELVMGLCDRVYALEFGKLIAEGAPAEVRSDDAVIRAYLGAEEPDLSTADKDVAEVNR